MFFLFFYFQVFILARVCSEKFYDGDSAILMRVDFATNMSESLSRGRKE
jgi:hypothetical protein